MIRTLVRFLLIFLLLFCLPNEAFTRDILAGPIKARVLKVRDGDSIDVVARVWLGQEVRVSIRLRGIDAPELRAGCRHEKEMALAAKRRLEILLSSGVVILKNISGGKYFGRVLARVETESGLNIQQVLLAENLVRPYRGRKRKSWCLQKRQARH